MEPLPLEVDQTKIVPVLLGDKPAIAPPRPAARSKPVVVDEFPGKKYPAGTIPPEWFAWFEENMDRGVDANELLKILVSKGFQPAKCSRLMQFISAHESLTVTSTMPVREESGQVVVVPTTATIIGTLESSSNLPPQWTAWLRDNIQMGVDKGLLFEILVKHGFEPAKNPLLVQALTQPHHEPSSVSRMALRTQAAQEKEERVKREKEMKDFEAKKARALDFASERGVIVADDLAAQRESMQKKLELSQEKGMIAGRAAQAIRSYGIADETLDVGVMYPDRPPQFTHQGRSTIGGNHKAVEAGLGSGSRPLKREGPHRLELPTPNATLLMASQSGVGVDDTGEEGASFWGAVLRGDLEEVRRYLAAGQSPSEPSPVKNIPPAVIATVHRRLDVLKLLVTSGASVNHADKHARTPLHYAAGSGELDTVTYLVTNGGDLFHKDNYGDTPVHVAASRGFPEVMQWMYMYIEERLLRHTVEWTFVEWVKTTYNKLMEQRIPQSDRQFFRREWTWEVFEMSYDAAPKVRQLFLPKPFKAPFVLADERFGGDPGVEFYTLEQVTLVVQKAYLLSVTMVVNRSGRTTLHMAADPPHHTITDGHVECVRMLVDVFAADVNMKDNAGRTAMSTLVARHKTQRAGIGPHAAKKLELIDSLAKSGLVEREDGEDTERSEGTAPSQAAGGADDDVDENETPIRRTMSVRKMGETPQLTGRSAISGLSGSPTRASRKAPEVVGNTAQAMQYLRIAEARYVEGMRACEWGCRQWIKRGLQEKHMQKTCPRRIFPCKFKCGVSIRAEQWEVIGDRHYEHECARRLVPCPLECGGMYADEDVAEHKVRTCVKRPAKPIACPNKCGLKITGSYDRVRDLEFEVSEHAKEACPMRVVSCDFNGCNETMFAKDRRDHRDLGIALWTTPGKYVYTVPKMTSEIMLEVWGGGGGGGQFKHVKGGNGGGGSFVQTIVPVRPGDHLTIVVGGGGSRGIHGVTATPVNEVLKRPEIKQETGRAVGGQPGGGTGLASNSTFAAGGGGGYSAVYIHGPLGLETLVIAGGGGGGGTRDGRPGGIAYVIGQNGDVPDVGIGGSPEEEVSESSEEEIDLNSWMEKLKERKRLKESGGGRDPFARDGDGSDDDFDEDGTGSYNPSRAASRAGSTTASPKAAARRKKRGSKGRRSRLTGSQPSSAAVSVAEWSSDSDEVSSEDDGGVVAAIPGGRPGIDLRSQKEKLAEMKQAEMDAAALRRSNVTADGDDKLRTGRNGGVKAPGKGGYKGGHPGESLKGGDGAELFGAGGGGGLYGGGGGGTTPGMVGGGGGGSSWVTSKRGYTPTVLPGNGRQPGGVDRFAPEATFAGDWDFMGGPAGLGGIGTKELLTDGHGGAVRIRLPGYFDITLEKDFKAGELTTDTGFDGKHVPGIRPNTAELERVKHTLTVPKPRTEDV